VEHSLPHKEERVRLEREKVGCKYKSVEGGPDVPKTSAEKKGKLRGVGIEARIADDPRKKKTEERKKMIWVKHRGSEVALKRGRVSEEGCHLATRKEKLYLSDERKRNGRNA